MLKKIPTLTLNTPLHTGRGWGWGPWGRVLLSHLSPLIQESEVGRNVARAHLP